jgi:hypothetical protein
VRTGDGRARVALRRRGVDVMRQASVLIGPVLLCGWACAAGAGERVVAPANAPTMCREYADAINTRRVAPPKTPLACDRGLWEDPEFSPGARRVTVAPEIAQLLLLDVALVNRTVSLADYDAQHGDVERSPDASASRRSPEYPIELAARFEPQIDIDNDGTPDDVALVGNSGMPCGFFAAHAQELNNVSLAILDSRGRLDSGRTFRLYRPQSWGLWVEYARQPTPVTRGVQWQDIFSVFRFQGATYFDRRGLRDPAGRHPKVVYGVFKATSEKVQQVCELGVRPTKDP